MRKIIVLISVLIASLNLFAQGYEHSVGINVGTLYSLSYKAFVFKSAPELALQIDGGINVFATAGTAYEGYYDFASSTQYTWTTNFGRMLVYDLVLQPSLVYQKEWTKYEWGVLSWFAGGGFNIGYMRENDPYYNYATGENNKYFDLMIGKAMRGKFGVDAVAGLEMRFTEAPLALSVDFRPGYGTGWGWETGEHGKRTIQLHYLDWTVAIGLRYCIPQKTTKKQSNSFVQ